MSEKDIELFAYSTFEDAIPDDIKNEWTPVHNPLVHKLKSEHQFECPIHKTRFNRTEEPCWQCYNPYE